MDRNDAASSPPHAELIRDLGMRRDWRTEDAMSEGHLMELAGDPLHVWAMLSGRKDDDQPRMSLPRLPAEAAIALGCRTSSLGSLDRPGHPDSRNHLAWDDPAPPDAPALRSFEPSGEDRANALELGFTSPAKGKAHLRCGGMVISGMVLVSILIWFWFRFILT